MNCWDVGSWPVAPMVVIVPLVFFVAFIVMSLIIIKTWIYCMIFHKAGYGWAWGLLILVPIANIIIHFVLALGDWPVSRELRQLRQQITSMSSKPQGS
jgi:hypothetical protein